MHRVLLVALIVVALPWWAEAETRRHSGTVVAVDRAAGTLVVGEVGPWQAGEAAPTIMRRTVRVTSATAFVRAERAPGPPETRGIGAFTEVPLRTWEVKEGDFVTVEVQREGAHLAALRVTVVTPTGR